jgi:hypothetical protein
MIFAGFSSQISCYLQTFFKLKNSFFWDVTPSYRLHDQGEMNLKAAKLVTTDVHSSLILYILMMVAILSSKTSVLTRATRRHI